MGYSCAKMAADTLDQMMNLLQEQSPDASSNCWTFKGQRYMYERGNENYDGAFTGPVCKFVEDNRCRRAGGIRIDGEGKIIRWPGTSKEMWKIAEQRAKDGFVIPFRPRI